VRELIEGWLGGAAVKAHHSILARRLATWPPRAEPTARRYTLRHALLHRVEAGRWADAWNVAGDMAFIEEKCRELGTHESEADVALAAERCRATDDVLLAKRFFDLARALAANRIGYAPLQRRRRQPCGTACDDRAGVWLTWTSSFEFVPRRVSCASDTLPHARVRPWSEIWWAMPLG
jgi:hypothetical protein